MPYETKVINIDTDEILDNVLRFKVDITPDKYTGEITLQVNEFEFEGPVMDTPRYFDADEHKLFISTCPEYQHSVYATFYLNKNDKKVRVKSPFLPKRVKYRDAVWDLYWYAKRNKYKEINNNGAYV